MGKRSVSDHAVVRWMERAYGIDIAEVREEILAAIHSFSKPGGKQQWEAIFVHKGETLCAIIRGGNVITIQKPRRIKPRSGSKP